MGVPLNLQTLGIETHGDLGETYLSFNANPLAIHFILKSGALSAPFAETDLSYNPP